MSVTFLVKAMAKCIGGQDGLAVGVTTAANAAFDVWVAVRDAALTELC